MSTWIAAGLGLLLLTGVLWLLRAWWFESGTRRVPILAYHRLLSHSEARAGRVRDDEPMWVVYDDAFAEQMAELARTGATPIDLDDYLAIRTGHAPAPPRPVVITFDDGYASNFTLAYPVLRKHGFKATIFVALDPDEHTRRQVEGVDAFLDAAQLQELAANGISIQSHTLTHAILSELDDRTLRHELQESRRQLEAITGRAVRHFCVPRGGADHRVRQQIQEAGYATATGLGRGTASDRSDLLALPRIAIERDMGIAAFRRSWTLSTSVLARCAGDLKGMPARLLGARRARRLRDRIYTARRARHFSTAALARALLAAGALVTAGTAVAVYASFAR